MTTEYLKPLPTASGETKPFWDAARRGRFLTQRCNRCQEYQWYPRGFCSNCWTQDIEWVEASGKGTVWSYTITYQNRSPGFREEGAYVLALVALEEGGTKAFTNIVDCNPQDVYIGMPVEVVFRDAPGFKIPFFKPAG